MRGSKAGSLVLPRYNSDSSGLATSPTNLSRTGPLTSPVKGSEMAGEHVPNALGDSILDIEGGDEDGLKSASKNDGAAWWSANTFASPMRTAVFASLGSAVSSGWSKARGAVTGSSIASYVRRVSSLEKPFDLKDIHGRDSGEI